MAWQITGTYWAPCSCKVGCPCTLGEMEGDFGWCSGAVAFDIRSGAVNGTDVAGCKVVLAADWPSGFLAGNGKGRLYFDPALSQDQRAALEPLIKGQLGGPLEAMSALVPEFLPPEEAAITIKRDGDESRITVGDVGALVSKRLRGAGRRGHAPASRRGRLQRRHRAGERHRDGLARPRLATVAERWPQRAVRLRLERVGGSPPWEARVRHG